MAKVPARRWPQIETRRRAADPHPERSAIAIAAGAALLAASALINRHLARKAERDNPPRGRFAEIDGVRLHYVERGEGRPLVLLHGNGSMIQDFETSGLIDMAAGRYRTVAFDRPGFGHSSRPRGVAWTPEAQADLFKDAFDRLRIERPVVLGHSWGALVAVALAARHPTAAGALVLASGYYYPTFRGDAAMSLLSAAPVIGDVLSHTVSPLAGRLLWPTMLRKAFGPQPVPAKFDAFPKEMAVRPSQMRATAAEGAMMPPAAFRVSETYARITVPTVIVAGDEDRLIDIDRQSARLHGEMRRSLFRRIAGAGHMIQQTETSDLMAAIDEAAAQAESVEKPAGGFGARGHPA